MNLTHITLLAACTNAPMHHKVRSLESLAYGQIWSWFYKIVCPQNNYFWLAAYSMHHLHTFTPLLSTFLPSVHVETSGPISLGPLEVVFPSGDWEDQRKNGIRELYYTHMHGRWLFSRSWLMWYQICKFYIPFWVIRLCSLKNLS